jgi:signal transduction histidine kinase
MKERLKLIGGELVIESHSKRGTTVQARAPVRRS